MSEFDSLAVDTDARRSGDDVTITLTVRLPEGTHIEPHEPPESFLIPTVLATDDLREARWTYPEPVTKELGYADMAVTVLEGTLEFTVTGTLATASEVVRGTFSFQPCVGGACLPPRTIAWEAPVGGASSYTVLRALAA